MHWAWVPPRWLPPPPPLPAAAGSAVMSTPVLSSPTCFRPQVDSTMSSKTVRTLYRMFLRQAQALERQGLQELPIRAPVNRGAPCGVGVLGLAQPFFLLPDALLLHKQHRPGGTVLLCRAELPAQLSSPLDAVLAAEAWMGGPQHEWAPPRDEFYLQSFKRLAPWVAQVRRLCYAAVVMAFGLLSLRRAISQPAPEGAATAAGCSVHHCSVCAKRPKTYVRAAMLRPAGRHQRCADAGTAAGARAASLPRATPR